MNVEVVSERVCVFNSVPKLQLVILLVQLVNPPKTPPHLVRAMFCQLLPCLQSDVVHTNHCFEKVIINIRVVVNVKWLACC